MLLSVGLDKIEWQRHCISNGHLQFSTMIPIYSFIFPEKALTKTEFLNLTILRCGYPPGWLKDDED